jgi:hypothetical protein
MKGYNGHGLKPETCRWLNELGSFDELMSYAQHMSLPYIPNKRVKRAFLGNYSSNGGGPFTDPDENEIIDR